MSGSHSQPSPPLLDVQSLTVEFSTHGRRPPLRAVDGIDLRIDARETVGLVGESGSGKTTLGRAILGLVPIADGKVFFDDEDITRASYRDRRRLSADLQVVFQDPYSSLNPTRTIGQTLTETLRVHGGIGRAAIAERVQEILERVGLPSVAAKRYPAHFSGGQRQRIAIARALIVRPRLVICDEPVSALDLSVQAQVLNLLRDLQHELELSYLFIAHDLDVVHHFSHRIVVLYRGRIMEQGHPDVLYHAPAHPYTRALLDAVPVPDPEAQRQRRSARVSRLSSRETITSENACPFAPRCPFVLERCYAERPQLEARPDGGLVACHRWRELGRHPLAASRDEMHELRPRRYGG